MEAAHHRHLADPAGADHLGRLGGVGTGHPLNAALDDSFLAAGDLDHAPALDDGERQRLLAVDVLAGLAGVDRLQRVPVVRGDDHHRVEVGPLQQLAVVVVLLGLAADLGGGEVEVRLVDVADRRDLAVLVLQKGVEHLVAAVAQADEADAHAVVGAEHAAGAEGGGGQAARGGVGELSTAEAAHGGLRRAAGKGVGWRDGAAGRFFPPGAGVLG
ncbi:MAG: hypothetical protein U0736_09295 [Gemmataceae bacterium]